MEPTTTYLLMIGQYADRSVLAVIHGTARDAHHAAAVMTIERAHRTYPHRPPGDLIAVDVEPVDVVDREGSTVTAAVEPDPPTPTEPMLVTIRPNVVMIYDITRAPVAFAVPAGLASLALPPELAAWWFVWAAAVAVGIAVHIWGDARTISGVPWRGRRGRIGRPFRTGGDREKRLAAMVYRPCAVASLALAVIAISAT